MALGKAVKIVTPTNTNQLQYTIENRIYSTADGPLRVARKTVPVKQDPEPEVTDGTSTNEDVDEMEGVSVDDVIPRLASGNTESGCTTTGHLDIHDAFVDFAKTDGPLRRDVGVQVDLGMSESTPRSRKRESNSTSEEESVRWRDFMVEHDDHTESGDKSDPSSVEALFHVSSGCYYSPSLSVGETKDLDRVFQGKYLMAPVRAGLGYVQASTYTRLEKIVSEAEWSGDYTVWMSPLTGKYRWERSRFIARENRTARAALLELQQMRIWKPDCYTFVYMTSTDKNIRWFVKATPVLSEREEVALVRERKLTLRKAPVE